MSAHENTAPNRLFPAGDKISNKAASWRTILILDSSAPLEVQYHIYERFSGQWIDVKTQLKQATPITLGDVVDCTKTLVEKAWKSRNRHRSDYLQLEEAFDTYMSELRHTS